MLRIALAVLHLLALGIGVGAIHGRARALRALTASPDALRRAFAADAWWGIAALAWIATGLWRALAGTEKAPDYYWSNHVFYAKMGLFALVFALELRPMATLTRWRRLSARGALPPASELAPAARTIARLSDVQTALLVAIVVAAVLMARGYGST